MTQTKEIKAVVFDLWQTLLRPNKDKAESTYRTTHLEMIGDVEKFEVFRGDLMKVMTYSPMDVIRFAREQYGAKVPDNFAEKLAKAYKQENDQTTLYADTIPTLKKLREQGYKIGVISNVQTVFKKPFYTFGLDKLVDETNFSDEVGARKPEDKIYHLMRDKLGIPYEQMLMIGDNRAKDAEKPRELGMTGLWLKRGRPTDLATHQVQTLDDVFKYLRVPEHVKA